MNSVSSLATGSLQASVHGNLSGHCGVERATRNRAVVECFSADGRPADLRFTLRHSDHLARGGWVRVRLVSARGIGPDACSKNLDLHGALVLVQDAATRTTSRISPTGVRELHRFGDSVAVASAVEPGQRYVDAILVLRSGARPGCGTATRAVDLVPGPGPGATRLRMRIDLLRHRVEVIEPGPSIQTGIGTFTVNGRHGDAKARVEIAVDIPRPGGSF